MEGKYSSLQTILGLIGGWERGWSGGGRGLAGLGNSSRQNTSFNIETAGAGETRGTCCAKSEDAIVLDCQPCFDEPFALTPSQLTSPLTLCPFHQFILKKKKRRGGGGWVMQDRSNAYIKKAALGGHTDIT